MRGQVHTVTVGKLHSYSVGGRTGCRLQPKRCRVEPQLTGARFSVGTAADIPLAHKHQPLHALPFHVCEACERSESMKEQSPLVQIPAPLAAVFVSDVGRQPPDHVCVWSGGWPQPSHDVVSRKQPSNARNSHLVTVFRAGGARWAAAPGRASALVP